VSGYLQRLKAECSEKSSPEELPKLPKATFDSNDSTAGDRFVEIGTANKPEIEHKLPDQAMEARRQKVLAMLAENPGIKRAIITDTETDPEHVIIAIGLRGEATGELAIPKAKYDPFLILKW
jgi:hypothetical protein